MKNLLEEIKVNLININYYTDESINIEELKNGGYSFSFFKTVFMKIEYKKDKQTIFLKTAIIKELNSPNIITIKKINDLWSQVEIAVDLNQFISENAALIYEWCYLSQAVESFGCCSRFIKCSDNKKCMHPDILIAKGCQYRRNLESGKIFYGINKNI